MQDRGIFITFEGGDGAGKSTHLGYLTAALQERGLEVVRLREPGGTTIGEQLRAVVLDPDNDAMVDRCELLIYEAARAQIVGQVIRPALERGAIVLCDRFADSTLAYQHFGRGMSREAVEAANAFACQGIHPDRTILMLTGGNAQVGLARATRNQQADRLESAGVAFHNRVIEGFLTLAEEDPCRIRTVVSDGTKADTARKVFDELADLFPWMSDPACRTDEYFAHLETSWRASKGK